MNRLQSQSPLAWICVALLLAFGALFVIAPSRTHAVPVWIALLGIAFSCVPERSVRLVAGPCLVATIAGLVYLSTRTDPALADPGVPAAISVGAIGGMFALALAGIPIGVAAGRARTRRGLATAACALLAVGALAGALGYLLTRDPLAGSCCAAAFLTVAGPIGFVEARRMAPRRRTLEHVGGYEAQREAVVRLRDRLRATERSAASTAEALALREEYEAAVAAFDRSYHELSTHLRLTANDLDVMAGAKGSDAETTKMVEAARRLWMELLGEVSRSYEQATVENRAALAILDTLVRGYDEPGAGEGTAA